ncbi:hypothetical protein RMCBS344292_05834 [Rhizopus microsporus]|nr:hypothetical protein RMCBS344292_05834 [Rhizopus microsporus]
MSFAIPGYFFDVKSNKYYKITSSGPYSMTELRKRLAAEEEEEREKKAIKKPKPIVPTLGDFFRQRATGMNPQVTINGHIATLLTFMKPQSKVILNKDFEDPKVIMTGGPNYGNMLVASKHRLLYNIGYQINPSFQIWRRGHCRYSLEEYTTITSVHYSFKNASQDYDTVLLSTSDSTMRRMAIPKQRPLSTEEISHFLDDSGTTIRDIDHILELPSSTTELKEEAMFFASRDMFWTSATDDFYDSTMIGGDKHLYQLTSSLRRVGSRKVRSSVFDVHFSKNQPANCYVGSRDGSIKLMDLRENTMRFNFMFEASSSVTKMAELDRHQLLTVSMDGSIDIWDNRQLRSDPVRSLKGHRNEATHSLAFDIDLDNKMLLVAGDDGHVRIWSYSNYQHNQPVWKSNKFPKPVTAAKLFIDKQFPTVQPNWSAYCKLKRHNPGLLIYSEEDDNNNNNNNNIPIAKYFSM